MLPSHSCASCSFHFSDRSLSKKLSNCDHIICERCANNACTRTNGFRCPVCNAPINVRNAKDLPTSSAIMARDDAKQQEIVTKAHIVGHKWLLKITQNDKYSGNVNFSLNIISDNVISEIIRMARNGSFQQHAHVIVYACIPLAWRIHNPREYNNLTLFLPNTDFRYQNFKTSIQLLMDALTSHRPDTQLHVFLPPAIDVNRFNMLQIQYEMLDYNNVERVCPEIIPHKIIDHTRFYVNSLHLNNFTDMPANIHLICGHDIAINFSFKVGSSIVEFLNERTHVLDLGDLYTNGVDPSPEFATELCYAMCKSVTDSSQSTSSTQINNPIKFFTQSGPDSNIPRKYIGDESQGIYADTTTHTQDIFNITEQSIPKDSDSHIGINKSIQNTKELTVGDSSLLIDATIEEIMRSAEHLKTVRNICYPSVTNDELAQAALEAVKQYFA